MTSPPTAYGSDQQSSAPMGPGAGADFFLANYRLGKTLGIGSFGKVKVAEHVLTGHQVAIKILNRRKIRQMEMEEKVLREIKILRLFLHPHIIRLYEIIDSPTDIFVVMEYVTAGELFDYIVEKGRLREDEARKFFQQIISGVEYCHRNMVVHRDLKPENLLLDNHSNVKIADFGLSNVMRDGHFLKTSCGSPNYAAPEVISGRLYAGPEVDVWSCGVILYALLCGSLPFDDENIPNLFKKIKGGIYNLPSHLSPGARDLIPRMLLVDPLKRITIPEIRQHPWFRLHLPRYLAVMQADTVATSTHVDDDVVDEVVRLGFSRGEVAESVKSRSQNKATIAYYLVVDFKRKNNSNAYLREEMVEANDVMLQHPSGMMGPSGNNLQQQRMVVEKRWRLGLTCRGPPPHLIHEVLRVLQRLHVGWKKMGPYCLKCRAVLGHRTTCSPTHCRLMPASAPSRTGSAGSDDMEPGTPQKMEQAKDSMGDLQLGEALGPPAQQQQILKFAIQVYKLRDGEYCLDFQRLTGDLFLFMDLCGVLLSNLRP